MGAAPAPGSWRITAGPYEIACDDDERIDWVWVVARGREVRSVRVHVAPEAWAARSGDAAPRPVREAIASRGATAVIEAVRGRHEPAPLLQITLAGVEARARD
jgi:hypothetical protein